ncbi:hypothetical protein HSBAA_PA_1290 (plasmid) [Vreelandella sulfidaeris]|uniref:Uncharacterized protein n=1 Tax=Vreelandella sulfidaeris TaxID=115553 RepID=A0A455UGY0_9GAMM|nr:hypothetical protein HSBAA_PA_1290 [Halomonas sulfidaeris]
MVVTEIRATIARQATSGGINDTKRANATAAPILGITVKKAATGAGEPWATSGIQAWAGKAASLKDKPSMIEAVAMVSARLS